MNSTTGNITDLVNKVIEKSVKFAGTVAMLYILTALVVSLYQ